jgi:hypothetical protein
VWRCSVRICCVKSCHVWNFGVWSFGVWSCFVRNIGFLVVKHGSSPVVMRRCIPRICCVAM